MRDDNRTFKLINRKDNENASATINTTKRQTTENKQIPTSKTDG